MTSNADSAGSVARGWDWELGRRTVAEVRSLGTWRELMPSPDGERLAAVVGEDGAFAVKVNGAEWEGTFEKAWHLAFTPDGRLTALVRRDDEWTVAVDGALWEERFSFAWNTRFSQDGGVIAVQIKRGTDYGIAVDGRPWPRGFLSCRDYALSADGKHVAATVQVEGLPEAGIFKFLQGTWSVAVDGEPWHERFINVYSPTFSPDGQHVGAQVRVDLNEYTLAQDGVAWPARFGCVWEPQYQEARLLAPVRLQGAWTLASEGAPLWKRRYVQLWNLRQSGDGRRVAAVVAPSFGAWTVAVDDAPWSATFSDLVQAPVLAGTHVAAAVKHEGRWGIAVDGQVWERTFEMVWDPILDATGERVVARVDVGDARYGLATSKGVWSRRFERLWDPCFSPDGERVLVRGVDDGKYLREVVPFTALWS
jgi:hypothetical protein